MDLERTMAHIVEQQAKFETDIAAINETIRTTNETIRGLVETSRLPVEVSRMQSEPTDRLEHDLAKGFATMVDAHNRLARAQEEADRRLTDFIAQVPRYLSSGNGHQRGSGSPETK